MQALSELTECLTARFGAFMTTAEVATFLKYHPQTIQQIPEEKLPRRRQRGRGGNRYLVSDVARYAIDFVYPKITENPALLASSVIVGRPAPVESDVASRLRAAGQDAAAMYFLLLREYHDGPFERDIAFHKLGLNGVGALERIQALIDQCLLIEDEVGFLSINHSGASRPIGALVHEVG